MCKVTKSSGGKVDHRQSTKLGSLLEKVKGHSELLGIAIQLC